MGFWCSRMIKSLLRGNYSGNSSRHDSFLLWRRTWKLATFKIARIQLWSSKLPESSSPSTSKSITGRFPPRNPHHRTGKFHKFPSHNVWQLQVVILEPCEGEVSALKKGAKSSQLHQNTWNECFDSKPRTRHFECFEIVNLEIWDAELQVLNIQDINFVFKSSNCTFNPVIFNFLLRLKFIFHLPAQKAS